MCPDLGRGRRLATGRVPDVPGKESAKLSRSDAAFALMYQHLRNPSRQVQVRGSLPPDPAAVGDLLLKHLGVLKGAPGRPASERQPARAARINPAPIDRATAGTAFPSWSAREDQRGEEPCNEYSGDDRDHSHQRGDPGRLYRVKARPGAVPAESIHGEQQACGPTDDSRHDVGNDGGKADKSLLRLRIPSALHGHGRSVGLPLLVQYPTSCADRVLVQSPPRA